MEYREFPPHPVLAPWVECFWFLRAPAEPAVDQEAPERLLPDGRIELIIHLGDRFRRIDEDGQPELQDRLLIAGPMSRHILLAPSGRSDVVGIRFLPAGATRLLEVPATEFAEEIVEVGGILRQIDPDLSDRLAEQDGLEDRAALLDRLLLQRFDVTRGLPEVVVEATRRLMTADGNLEIAALAATCGLGTRQLERLIKQTTGLSPKLLARILRFQSAVRRMEGEQPISLSMLALHSGYSDQSHMNRDFRQFAGLSPTAWMKEQHGLSNYFTGTADDMTTDTASYS